jgi:hypothetical protein
VKENVEPESEEWWHARKVAMVALWSIREMIEVHEEAGAELIERRTKTIWAARNAGMTWASIGEVFEVSAERAIAMARQCPSPGGRSAKLRGKTEKGQKTT